jgi:AraC-like DNA-binding protein
MAFLYLDPLSADVAALRASMRRDHGHFLVGLRHEAAALAAFKRIARREIEPRIAWAELATILRLDTAARKDPRIIAAVEHMRAAPGESHSLADLAATARLSTSRFLHLFKETTGVPLRRFRIWNRMGAAIRSVVGGATLTEAAHRAGFASSAHFSAAFRDMFGLAPSELGQVQLTVRSDSPPVDRVASS